MEAEFFQRFNDIPTVIERVVARLGSRSSNVGDLAPPVATLIGSENFAIVFESCGHWTPKATSSTHSVEQNDFGLTSRLRLPELVSKFHIQIKFLIRKSKFILELSFPLD